MERYINPYSDFGFKKLFGEEGNKELLRDFLNTLLPAKHQIATLTFANGERLGDNRTERMVAFDIHCKNEKGEPFIVEMQRAEQDHFIERAIIYICDVVRSQNPRPKDPVTGKRPSTRKSYNLIPVYFIGILDFLYDNGKFKHELFLRHIDLRDQNGELVTKLLHLTLAQMPLFNKTPEELVTQQDKWFYFLHNLTSFERIPAILNEPIFQQAFETASYVALTPEEQEAYKESNRERDANVSALAFAHEKGIAKGIRKTARNLKKMGLSAGDIEKATGLTAAQIKKL
jgi:predicted transposase/invertase (TIGR01784 family)